MKDKKHLTEEGLREVMSIRVLMNKKTPITYYSGSLMGIPTLDMHAQARN